MARPPVGSLAWAKRLHDSGVRVEYWSERWETWFEAAPTGNQTEWRDLSDQPLRWRIRPAYTAHEAMLQAVTTEAAETATRSILDRLFGRTPRSQ